MNQPIFVVSLDFELHWGGFEKWDLTKYKQYFLNTRDVIPQMLSLFNQFGIHTTWATVGMLFHDSQISLNSCVPILKPSYDQLELSPYNFINKIGIGNSEEDDPFHFGASLIAKIINTPFQELGSHTFAHYYCNEPGQSVEEFKSDLSAAQQSAMLYGKNLRSLVFPRNQFNDQYLRACYDFGFIAVRDNPRDWFWNIRSTKKEPYWKRLNRGLDAYLPLGTKNTYPLSSLTHIPGLPICIPASRLLRPFRPMELFLNKLKIERIKNEMERAGRNGEIYHLWWHPHNFGNHPKQNLDDLLKILEHFSRCRDKYGMKSLSMSEIAECVVNSSKA